MKYKLILNYAATIISLVAMIVSFVKVEWYIGLLCVFIFAFSLSNVIHDTIDYIEYKQTERQVFEYFLANRDKLIEQYKKAEFEHIFGKENEK